MSSLRYHKPLSFISITWLLGATLVAYSLSLLFDLSIFSVGSSGSVFSLLPFFILGGEGGGGSCCSCGNSGGNTCYGSSTPFLYPKTKNGFEMDNDVMFGKPSSYFASLEQGIAAHMAGKVKGDLYLIQKEMEVVDGKVQVQIKEIEPEVSALSSVRLYRVPVRKGDLLVTKSDFTGCVRISDINKQKQVNISCYDLNRKDITDQLGFVPDRENEKATNSILLESGEYIDIEFEATDNSDQYLILQSWYRDWMLGDVYSDAGAFDVVLSPFQKNLKNLKTKTIQGVATGFMATLIGYLGLTGGVKSSDDSKILSSAFGFGAKTANAETPSCTRSLELSYELNDQRVKYEVVEPRYARPASSAIPVPKESIKNGKGAIRIVATKRHKVSGIAIAKAEKVDVDNFEELSLESAYHHGDNKDYTETFVTNEKVNSGVYVRTKPSDVLTFTFESNNNDPEIEYAYLMGVSGVYAPASREDQQKRGDWTKKLDPEALAFLSEVYHQSSSFTNKINNTRV